jgi:DNA-binding XRE family transcriptional regulator
VAFANEGEVEQDDEYIARVQRMREKAGVTGSPVDPKLKGMYEERIAGLGGRRESDIGFDIMELFSGMNVPGSTLSAGIEGARKAIPGIAKRRADLRAEELAATTGLAGLTKDERADMLGITKEAMALREKDLDRERALKVARIGATPRDTDIDKNAALKLAKMIAPIEQGGLGLPNNVATRARARTEAIEEQGLAFSKLAGQQEDRITKAWEKIDDEFYIKELQAVTKEEKEKVASDKQAAKNEAARRLRPVTPTSTDPNTAVPKKDDKVALAPPPAPKISTITGAPEGSKIGSFVNGKGYEVLDKNGKLAGYAQPN